MIILKSKTEYLLPSTTKTFGKFMEQLHSKAEESI